MKVAPETDRSIFISLVQFFAVAILSSSSTDATDLLIISERRRKEKDISTLFLLYIYIEK
jgi:hypothetical protein